MDASLVEHARAGDADAFDELVRRRIDAVYRTALGILGEPADARDAAQEALVLAWRQLPSLREAERFDAWLNRITINCCRMALRKRKGVRELRLTADVQGSDDGSAVFDGAFERLTVDQRAILLEHHLDGRSVAEIAERLGIPAGTVKSRLFAARRELEHALEEERR
jgi:RNA polymerase sigma-70 factor, ECF subfamily